MAQWCEGKEKLRQTPPNRSKTGFCPLQRESRGILELRLNVQQLSVVDRFLREKASHGSDAPVYERLKPKHACVCVGLLHSFFLIESSIDWVVSFDTVGSFNEVIAQNRIRLTHQRCIKAVKFPDCRFRQASPAYLANWASVAKRLMSPISAKIPAA